MELPQSAARLDGRRLTGSSLGLSSDEADLI
jgi:hypothetical protein